MSMRVYLDKEKVRNARGFMGHVEDGTYTGRQLDGICIRAERSNGAYFMDFEETAMVPVIPASVGDFVIGCSLKDDFEIGPCRKLGEYKYKNAKAIVSKGMRQGRPAYLVSAEGEMPEDVVVLYKKIRAGEILPKQYWEEEQIKPSPTLMFLRRVINFCRI